MKSKKTDEVREALKSLCGIPPIDFVEAVECQRENDRRKNEAWRKAEKEAREPYKIIKRYVREKLKLGKLQSIAFHGQGITAFYANPKWNQVCSIDATIRTGVGGVEIRIQWRSTDLIGLDSKLAAVRDMLAAARMG